MIRNRRERGEGQGGCIVGLIFLLVAVLIAYKMIPVKVKTAELRQTVVDEARSAGRHNDKAIAARILHRAEELQLPVTEKNIEVRRAANIIRVRVSYTVPVQFPGYLYQWEFEHKAENPIF